MTYTEIVAEIPHLSDEERLALMQVLIHSFTEEDEDSTEVVPSDTILGLRGALRDIVEMPTDEAVHEEYKAYLEEKYR